MQPPHGPGRRGIHILRASHVALPLPRLGNLGMLLETFSFSHRERRFEDGGAITRSWLLGGSMFAAALPQPGTRDESRNSRGGLAGDT